MDRTNRFSNFALRVEEVDAASDEDGCAAARNQTQQRHRMCMRDSDSDDNRDEKIDGNVNSPEGLNEGWVTKRNAATMSTEERRQNAERALLQRQRLAGSKQTTQRRIPSAKIPKKQGCETSARSCSSPNVVKICLDNSESEPENQTRKKRVLEYAVKRKQAQASERSDRAKRRRILDDEDDEATETAEEATTQSPESIVHVTEVSAAAQGVEEEEESGSESNSVSNESMDETEAWERARVCVNRCQALASRLKTAMRNWTSVNVEDVEESTTDRLNFTSISGDGEGRLIRQEDISSLCVDLQLKAYQLVGVNWLRLLHEHGLNGVLADEMGLGKTVQCIAFLAWLKYNKEIARSAQGQGQALVHSDADAYSPTHLIVVPASTINNWVNELRRFCPSLVVQVFHGAQKITAIRKMKASAHNSNARHRLDVVLTTYTLFERMSTARDRAQLKAFKFDYLILDEAHCLKNAGSARYENLRQLKTRHRLLLSGTPVQNNLGELLALLCFVMPEVFDLDDAKVLLQTYGQELEQLKESTTPSQQQNAYTDETDSTIYNIRRLLAPFILRRLKSEVLSQLTLKQLHVVTLDLLPQQKLTYDSILEAHVNRHARRADALAGAISASETKHIVTELRKAANHPLLLRRRFSSPSPLEDIAATLRKAEAFGENCTLLQAVKEMETYSDFEIHKLCLEYPKLLGRHILDESTLYESCKIKYLADTIPSMLAQGHRILVFSQWTSILDLLELLMQNLDLEFLRLDGSTPVTDRQPLVDRFNSTMIPIFLLSTRAGGLGINLTSADTVIMHDLDFNPENDKQAEDRCHRIGQTKPVHVYKLVASGTIDEGIFNISERKRQLGQALLRSDGSSEGIDSISGILSEALQGFMDRGSNSR